MGQAELVEPATTLLGSQRPAAVMATRSVESYVHPLYFNVPPVAQKTYRQIGHRNQSLTRPATLLPRTRQARVRIQRLTLKLKSPRKEILSTKARFWVRIFVCFLCAKNVSCADPLGLVGDHNSQLAHLRMKRDNKVVASGPGYKVYLKETNSYDSLW